MSSTNRNGARLLQLIVTIALLWQGCVAGTHIHLAARPIPVAAAFDRPAGLVRHMPAPIAPDGCPLCHALSLSGHYLPPTGFSLPVPPASVVWAIALAVSRIAHRRHSHGWQSRAPPGAVFPLIR